MIFTIGNITNYERFFVEQGFPQKGVGGSVWRFPIEAIRRACSSNVIEGGFVFGVYGVEADWLIHTKPSSEGPWHDLLENRYLRKLTPLTPRERTEVWVRKNFLGMEQKDWLAWERRTQVLPEYFLDENKIPRFKEELRKI